MMCERLRLWGRRLFPGLAILYAAGVLAWPVLFLGFPAPTHDGELHELWADGFARQWRELYPRWLSEMNEGRGSPVFFYYPPVPYYLTSAASLSMVGPRRLGCGAMLALVGSGWMAFGWLSKWVDRRSALCGALVYMALPYHVAVDLYQRGAFAELWAFVWLPGLVAAAGGIDGATSSGKCRLAIFQALLLGTHPPTALMVGPLPVFCAAAMTPRPQRLGAILESLASVALGFGLAAVYLVPALTMQDHVQMEVMHEGPMHFSQSFLGSPSTFAARLVPTFVFMGSLAVGAGLVVALRERDPVRRRALAVWLATAGGALFMATSGSVWLYRLCTPLQVIQFPWRFGVVLVLADAALAALAWRCLRSDCNRAKVAVVAGLVLVWVWLTLPPIRTSGLRPRADRAGFMSDRLAAAREAPEYVTRWTVRPIDADSPRRWAKVSLSDTSAHAEVRQWSARRILLRVQSGRPVIVELDRYYFPGWQAEMEGGRGLELGPSLGEGLLRLVVPTGRHDVLLILTRSEGERWGTWISVVSALLLPGWGVASKRWGRRLHPMGITRR